MNYLLLNKHIAKAKMFLKNKRYSSSFITTVWNSEIIMCNFNNINKTINNIFSIQEISEEELRIIEDLIIEFMSNTVQV